MLSLQAKCTKGINGEGTQIIVEENRLLGSFGNSFMSIAPVE